MRAAANKKDKLSHGSLVLPPLTASSIFPQPLFHEFSDCLHFISSIFQLLGNLPDGYPDKQLRELFEKYGEVTECDVLKNFGFVHFRRSDEADKAKDGLANHQIDGKRIRVESSGTGKTTPSGAGTKLFVGRILPVLINILSVLI